MSESVNEYTSNNCFFRSLPWFGGAITFPLPSRASPCIELLRRIIGCHAMPYQLRTPSPSFLRSCNGERCVGSPVHSFPFIPSFMFYVQYIFIRDGDETDNGQKKRGPARGRATTIQNNESIYTNTYPSALSGS